MITFFLILPCIYRIFACLKARNWRWKILSKNHIHFMQTALAEAKKAARINEVPIGAVLVGSSGEVLARAHNQTIAHSDPSAHAEILTMRRAGKVLQNYRLLNTTLYVTVEPCAMCMGAIIHARVAQLVFGAPDPKGGACGSLYDFAADARFNHRPKVIKGVCEAECRCLIQRFFQSKRNKNNSN